MADYTTDSMTDSLLIQVGITFGLIIFIICAVRYVNYLRKIRTNTELWGSVLEGIVFEGLTHKTMDLDALKQPEIVVEKRIKKSGHDKDQ
ncbi:MAG: hypothetical protein ACI92E_002050 [Oceanicoccus sp.]